MTATAVLREDLSRLVPVASAGPERDGPGRILRSVFGVLDSTNVPFCVLHGYENFSREIPSDVDCVIDPSVTPRRLYQVLHDNRERLGADLVFCRDYCVVLGGRNRDGSRCFLTLDFAVACEAGSLPLYSAAEIIASRRRHECFWIPAVGPAFACYLARSIAKNSLDSERGRRLSTLFRQDPAQCERQVKRFWGTREGEKILSAARSGVWTRAGAHLETLRKECRRRTISRHPARFARTKANWLTARIRSVWRPSGASVILLGPDGAGKSSTIAALGPLLSGAFDRSVCWGFAPPLHRLVRRGPKSTAEPHALPPRSPAVSLARAAYWFLYSTLGYPVLRLALARTTLVLYDRHFIDILVDPRRYRYGGPHWILRAIWRLTPRPDLVLLLDAPADVLQSRKQEVSFAETTRQREAYLELLQSIDNSHVVNAAQPKNAVADDAGDVVLRHLTNRIVRRYKLERLRAEPLLSCENRHPY